MEAAQDKVGPDERDEAQARAAAEALRALAAAFTVHSNEVDAARAMEAAHEATGWVSLPVAPDVLAKALLTVDLITVRRARWRRRVRGRGLQPEVVPLPPDLPDVDGDALRAMGKDERRRLDTLTATVLQLRGAVLRVDSGSPELRCRVDVPLNLPEGAPLFRSRPFRVTLVSVYHLLVDRRSEHARLEPCAEDWLRYHPALHTLELHLASRGGTGRFPLTAQPLAQDLDGGDFDAPAATTIAVDAALLQRALDAVSVSLPDRASRAKRSAQPAHLARSKPSRSGTRPPATGERFGFVEIRSGRALCLRAGESFTVFRNPGLAGLDLRLEAEDVAGLAQALGRLDPRTATLRISTSRYVFSDGTLTISVRRSPRPPISGADEDIEMLLAAPCARCTVDGGEMLQGLRWSFWGLTPDDHRTHVRLGPLHRTKRKIVTGDDIAQHLVGLGPGEAEAEAMPGSDLDASRADTSSASSDAIAAGYGGSPLAGGAVDGADGAAADQTCASEQAEAVPMSEWQPRAGWDTAPNGVHEVRDCLVFLTPGSQPSMGWNPLILDLVGPVRGERSAEWLRTGQIFDIRQMYRALLAGRQSNVEIRLSERRMVLEETDGADHTFTALLARDADGFWSHKLLPHWGAPAASS